eukprot:8249192-Alexandrium_andersonii.AAC.1
MSASLVGSEMCIRDRSCCAYVRACSGMSSQPQATSPWPTHSRVRLGHEGGRMCYCFGKAF